MINIINDIGRFINSTTRVLMGVPTQAVYTNANTAPRPANVPCTTCSQKAQANRTVTQPQNQVVFNAETQVSSPNHRQAGQVIQEPNLRDKPYMNNTGLKFN